MLTVNAYAATSPTGPLAPTTVERRDLGPRDLLIEIKYCGICHTDIHWVRGDWGAKDYPVVPGHEIAGIVTSPRTAVEGRVPTRAWLRDRHPWPQAQGDGVEPYAPVSSMSWRVPRPRRDGSAARPA